MIKKILKTIADYIIGAITMLAWLVFILSVCAIDTNSPVITGACCASLGWIILIGVTKCRRPDSYEEE